MPLSDRLRSLQVQFGACTGPASASDRVTGPAQRLARLHEAPVEARPDAAKATQPAHGAREMAFLVRLEAAVMKDYADPDFSVADLASRVAMSDRQLQRKVRALLGVSPADYLREVRLQKAAELLRAGHSATRVAMDTGFSSASHFGALFKARFNQTPGEYAALGAGRFTFAARMSAARQILSASR